jgi:predicted MPP superfamily phosphohydrolase
LAFPHISRRKFIWIAAGAGVTAIAADSTILEPNHPHVVRRDIALHRWPAQLQGFTIALLSDFHYDPYFSSHPLNAAIGIVNSLHPDLIVLTGDFVTAPSFDGDDQKAAANAEPCASLLRQMHALHGLWAVLGNHDWATNPRHVTGALKAEGIEVLANNSVPIEASGARFWLSGLKDILFGASDLNTALAKVPRDEATILLSHEPDYADYVARHREDLPVDLQLSGHSHGGQIRLPFVRPFYLPELAKRYFWGLYKVGSLTLYTNPGLGTMGVPIRWNCPPEITLLTLRSASS